MTESASDALNRSASRLRGLAALRCRLAPSIPPSHAALDVLYLRLLGLVYLIAFLSLWSQIIGLIGERGILPIKPYLAAIRAQAGSVQWHLLPTICWWAPGDASLHVQCAAGVVLSCLMIAGVLPALTSALLWVFYLSLCIAGQNFLAFQWDILLLEAGFLAIFFSPLQWMLHQARRREPSRLVLWLQRWLIFRLMFLSGVCKLASGDTAWRDGSALTYHYQSQPLPTWTSWYLYHQPRWMAHASTELTLAFELLLPLLMLGPRRVRHVAFASTVLLQILILATGNYGFFNLLAIVLCLPLLDDAALQRFCRIIRWRPRADAPLPVAEPQALPIVTSSGFRWPMWITMPLAIVIGAISIPQVFAVARIDLANFPLQSLASWAEPFRSVNSYGLFATMTRKRPEIILETSNDDLHWSPVAFRWKPGNVQHAPQFCTPHMPRLDWQMWFAALDWQGNSDVVEGLMRGILRGDRAVVGLLAANDFAAHPPRYVRAVFYDYTFTTRAQQRESGAWWNRSETGRVTPGYSLEGSRDTSQ